MLLAVIAWSNVGYSYTVSRADFNPTKDIVEEVYTQSYLDKKILSLHSSFEGAVLFLGSLSSGAGANEEDFTATGGPNQDEQQELPMVGLSALVSASPVLITALSGQLRSKEALTFSYEVEDGDTLSSIAVDFGVSLQTLLWANGISSRTVLRPGDILTILPVDGVIHTVKRGDTISSIGQRYKIRADQILTFNSLSDNDIIKIGDVLIIPGGSPRTSVRSSVASSPIQSLVNLGGYFSLPAKGRATQGLHQYNAVDIGGKAFCNTPVYAAAAGTVLLADSVGWNGGYGQYVKISHPNGTVTLYAHNAQNLIAQGAQVSKGQVIALMGSTGRTTGCHVHFEVRGALNPFAG